MPELVAPRLSATSVVSFGKVGLGGLVVLLRVGGLALTNQERNRTGAEQSRASCRRSGAPVMRL